MKVSEITTDLPPETLRKVDEWLEIKYGNIGNFRTDAALGGGGCVLYVNSVRRYTTSIDPALWLCERMRIKVKITMQFTSKSPSGVSIEKHFEYINSLSDLPSAIVRGVLRSQGIVEVEV